MDEFNAFFWGLFVGIVFFLIFLLAMPSFTIEKHNAIVWKTNEGIVCKVNKYYPELNCEAIIENLGPRLNTIKKEK